MGRISNIQSVLWVWGENDNSYSLSNKIKLMVQSYVTRLEQAPRLLLGNALEIKKHNGETIEGIKVIFKENLAEGFYVLAIKEDDFYAEDVKLEASWEIE